MATNRQSRAEEPPRLTRIPYIQFRRFRKAEGIDEVRALNGRIMQRELDKEKRIAEKLERQGKLGEGNGLSMFLAACRRRLRDRKWIRVLEHSDNVRKYAFCIARSWEMLKEDKNIRRDLSFLNIVAKVAGYHDIGKTLIAPYLVNREDGTWFGIGYKGRIDFEKELPVLRHAHVEAGVRLLRIYQDFMSMTTYEALRWMVGGHHIAFDGRGTASGMSYPEMMDGIPVEYTARKGAIPEAARIIRAADVYSAIMENRFYLDESERVVTKVTGMGKDDAALGLLITVAGTDVDPEMVKCLMMGKYHVEEGIAQAAVEDLRCKNHESLLEKGKDVKFALEKVLKQEAFHELISRRDPTWDGNTDFNVYCRSELV
jgi:response regulator RpfG family c-di-GMP phosphodiesterase